MYERTKNESLNAMEKKKKRKENLLIVKMELWQVNIVYLYYYGAFLKLKFDFLMTPW